MIDYCKTALLAATLLLGCAIPVFATSGDPERGAKIWKKCSACHEIGPGAVAKSGPPLNKLFGRTAGSFQNFTFSKAMIDAGEGGLVWEAEALAEFLERPKTFVPKTRMSFAGLRSETDRADLIAFISLHSDTENPDAAAGHTLSRDPAVPVEILAIKGDQDYGAYLSGTCVACHQISGADKGIPSITGWPTDAFVTVMFSYRARHRDNPVMQQIAGSLNNEEIAALAAYFETIKAAE